MDYLFVEFIIFLFVFLFEEILGIVFSYLIIFCLYDVLIYSNICINFGLLWYIFVML